jgi:hypothetical protein
LSILGKHLSLSGRYEEAEVLLLQGKRDLVAAVGENSPIVEDARARLGWAVRVGVGGGGVAVAGGE